MQKYFLLLSLIVAYCECGGNYGGSGSTKGGSLSSFGNSGSSGSTKGGSFSGFGNSGSSGSSSGGFSGFGNSGGGHSSSGSFSGFGSSSGGSGYGGAGHGSVSYIGGGSASMGGQGGPVEAAIETHRTVEVRPVNIPNEPVQPQIIEVPSEDLPVTVHFKSQSSRVHVQQTHIPGTPGETEHTSSEDEPHRVVHEVVKPVIQEIREIIQPYRRLVQQIQPVIEQTHTIIAKGEPRPQGGLSAPGGQGLSGTSSYGGSGGFSGSSGGFSGGSTGGSSSYDSSNSYSSRQGLIQSVPSSPGQAIKGQTVNIDNTGSGSTRIYSATRNLQRNDPQLRRMSYRARA